MKGKFNLSNKAKNYDNNNINVLYNTNKTNNDVYFQIPYDENTFFDDYNVPNAFNNNINLDDNTHDYYNKIEKKLTLNNLYENDLENDCNNLSDTSLMLSSLDCSNSKLNISKEIDRKIDDLIVKNIQKDSLSLKIQADYSFNKTMIYICILGIVYSALILIKPFNLNLAVYSSILLLIPFFIINIFIEFKNKYLKYSNELAKIIINFVGIYIFTCSFIFISLLILKFSEFQLINLYLSNVIYFIPVLSLLFVLIFFTAFLKPGFKKFEKEHVYYYILFNLILACMLTAVVYLKVSSVLGFLKWMHLMVFISLFHAMNFLGICYFNKHTNGNVNFEEFSEKNNDKSILAVFNVLVNFCLICFYFLLGLYLDNMLEKVKVNSLFILTWLFFFILLIKNSYQIKKIKSYLEWRNVVIS